MVSVTVVFTNGNVVEFAAQEFDVNLNGERGNVNKYPYKDAAGNGSSIHLQPAEVAGVFVTPDVDVLSVRIPLHT
ncbi:MAG TPA: hypothetical protein VI008_03390 [Rubrobacter sp.]|jgi:hypothetical protein